MSVHKIDGGPGGENNHFPKKFVTLYASVACNRSDWVMLTSDTTNGLVASVAPSNVTGNNEGAIFGIATETVAAGEEVVVQIAGKYENANVANSAAAFGDRLIASSTAGRAVEATTIDTTSVAAALDFTVCGIALEAASGNLADVMIKNQGYF